MTLSNHVDGVRGSQSFPGPLIGKSPLSRTGMFASPCSVASLLIVEGVAELVAFSAGRRLEDIK